MHRSTAHRVSPVRRCSQETVRPASGRSVNALRLPACAGLEGRHHSSQAQLAIEHSAAASGFAGCGSRAQEGEGDHTRVVMAGGAGRTRDGGRILHCYTPFHPSAMSQCKIRPRLSRRRLSTTHLSLLKKVVPTAMGPLGRLLDAQAVGIPARLASDLSQSIGGSKASKSPSSQPE